MTNERIRARWVSFGASAALIAAGVSGCLGERPTAVEPGDDGGTSGDGTTSGGSSGDAGDSGTSGGSSGNSGATGGASGSTGKGGSAGSAASGGSNSGTGGATGGATSGNGGNAGDIEAGVGPGGSGSVLPASELRFLSAPSVSYLGAPLYPVAVAITDANGATVTDASAEISLDLADNPGGANLVGYVTAETVDGVAYFPTVGIDQVAADYTLAATTTGLTRAVSEAFDVTPLPFTRVTTGLFGGIVTSVAVADDTTVYATSPVGVWKSTNRGSTWGAANFGNPGQAGIIAVDPENPLNLYITPSQGSGSFGGDSFFFGGRSDNGAEAWRSMGDEVGSGQIGTIAIDPENPAIIYAGGPFGLFRSTNGGETWIQTPFEYASYELSVDPITPTTIYAYGYDHDLQQSAGVFKSVNSGQAWTPINDATLTADASVTGIFAIPTGVFVASASGGMFRSVDGGANWEQSVTPGWEVAYAPSDVQRVYMSSGQSVAASVDGGATFAPSVSVGNLINGLAVDLTDPDRLYVASDGGVYTSVNGGDSFNETSIGISALSIGAVAMHPTLPETVIAGGPEGVYRTTNGGVTWTSIPLSGPITAITFDPANAETVYACSLGARFYTSTNGGQTWNAGVEAGGSPYCYDIVVRGQSIWLPTVGGGVRRSTNGGTSFGDTGITAATYGVDVDPTGQIVYAATNQGTQKSINAGTDFTPMAESDLGSAVLVDPADPTRIYIGMACGSAGDVVGNGGVEVSTDSGATFGEAMGFMCVEKLVGTSSGAVFAAGRGGSAFAHSTDNGGTWTPGGFGVIGEGVGLAVSSDAQTIYLSTTLGLYKSETGGF